MIPVSDTRRDGEELLRKLRTVPKLLWHGMAWSFFAFYFMGLFTLFEASSDYVENYVLYLLVNMALFYGHAFWVVPCLDIRNPKSWFKFIAGVVLEFILFFAVYIAVSLALGSLKIDLNMTNIRFDIRHADPFISPFLFIVGFSTLYRVLPHLFQTLLHEDHLAQSLVREQALGMRRKINAHHAINFLSRLYMKITRNDKDTLSEVIEWQRSLRYRLDDSFHPQPLRIELDMIRREIQTRERAGKKPWELAINADEMALDCFFIPMVIPTFWENMLKYGKLSDPLFPASLTVQFHNGHLYIKTLNGIKYAELISQSEIAGHGLGLKNINARLNIHYPNKYRFEYGREGQWFKVELEVVL